MEYRNLGRCGLKVSELCLGTMTFGQRTDEAEAHRIVGPYLADISCGSGGPRPAHLREQIRTRGPSNDPHARQAGE